jgi:hypothetical protein
MRSFLFRDMRSAPRDGSTVIGFRQISRPLTCSDGGGLGIGAAGQEREIDAVHWMRLDGRC